MSCSFIGRLNGCDFHRSFVKRWLSPGTQGKEKLRCLLCHSNAPADRLPSAKGQEGIKAQSANKNVGARTKHEEDAQIYLAVCLYCASCFCKKHESNHNTCDASGPGGERNDVERHPLFLRVYCDLLGCGTHSSDRRQPNPLPQLKMKNGTAIRENSTIKMSAIEDLQVQSSKDSPSPVIACLKCDKTSSQNVSHGTPAAKVEHYSDTLSNLKKPIYLYIMNVCVEDSSDDVEAGRYHLGISGSATTHGNATHFYSHPNEHHSVRSTQAVAPVHRIHPHKVGPQVLFEAKLVGLENPHNICYFNAVLQCVLKCHSFTEWISNVECSKVGILAEHMHKLVRRFNMSKTAQKWEEVKEHVYAIRSHLGEITPMFADDDQQDSQELFLSMINGVADEFDKLTPEKKEKLPPFPFKGVLLNEVRCLGCDNCAARKETFMALSIPVEETLTKGLSKVFEKVKLTDKDKYACEACFKALEPCAQRENNEATKLSNSNEKKKNPAAELKSLDCVYTDAEVQTNISEMGGILVVHLLRFHFNGKIFHKSNKEVDFPLSLDIKPYLSKELCSTYCKSSVPLGRISGSGAGHARDRAKPSSSSPSYASHNMKEEYAIGTGGTSSAQNDGELTLDLVGVVSHRGSLNGGHYVAFVRDRSNPPKWFCCDDDEISAVEETTVLGCKRDVYMLFYDIRKS